MPRYRLLICAEQPGMIRTMSGFNIEVPYDLSALHGGQAQYIEQPLLVAGAGDQ
ncbi:hypothetical protein AAKU55_005484 [Oxalobacteraceae bacterium GrIS 1.11]